ETQNSPTAATNDTRKVTPNTRTSNSREARYSTRACKHPTHTHARARAERGLAGSERRRTDDRTSGPRRRQEESKERRERPAAS
uniref:Uncharacterized protein n=2 Tax=Ixodes scapularis TaxID=6945 RepID=A0A1S4LHF0_IXOSC